MIIATWNVNGIRARQGQLLEWVERDRPDVVCLQEIKATLDQLPMTLCDLEGYWCYWHGGKGYSGVGLHVSRAAGPRGPPSRTPVRLRAPDRDGRPRRSHRRVVYVPNGGKDFPAKMRFLARWRRSRRVRARGRERWCSAAT
jgi:exodeoxyribonuclease III